MSDGRSEPLTLAGFSLLTCTDQDRWAGERSDVTKWTSVHSTVASTIAAESLILQLKRWF